MKTPEPWPAPASDATPSERVLLRSASGFEPPPAARDHVWQGLLAALPASPASEGPDSPEIPQPIGGTPGAAGGSAALASAGIAKFIAGGALLGLAVAGAGVAYRGSEKAPSPVTASASVVASPPAPEAAVSIAVPVEPPSAVDAPSQVSPSSGLRRLAAPSNLPERLDEVPRPALPSSAAFPLDRPVGSGAATLRALKEESALLERARAELRAGQPTQALATLATAESRFAVGALGQEREALAIEALAAVGRGAEASLRAHRFLARHPESPHAASVKRFAR